MDSYSFLTSLSFTGDSKLASSMRYVETQSMQIGASYMIQFNLVMGCGQKFTPHMDNQVKLEYSTNHGLTWHLVQEVRPAARPLSSINSVYTKIICNILVTLVKGGFFPCSHFYKETFSWSQSKWLIEVLKLLFMIFGREMSESLKHGIVAGMDQVWGKNWGTRQSYRIMAVIFPVLLLCFSK